MRTPRWAGHAGAALLPGRSVASPEDQSQECPCSPRASLVPVFSFGENELFQQFPNPPGSWVRRAQEGLQPLLRVALPLFRGPWGLPLPFRSPIHTVGEPQPLPAPLLGPPARSSRAQGSPRGKRRCSQPEILGACRAAATLALPPA